MEKKPARRADGNTLDPGMKRYIHDFCPRSEWERVDELVGRFCFNGQVAIGSLLSYAYEEGRLEVAVEVIEGHWEDHWRHQHPEVCGDTAFGEDNFPRLAIAYMDLGIIPPWEREVQGKR